MVLPRDGPPKEGDRDVKTRPLPYKGGRGRLVVSLTGPVKSSTTTHCDPDFSGWQGSQITESIQHPGWYGAQRRGNTTRDIGGDFYTQKRFVIGKHLGGLSRTVVSSTDPDGTVHHRTASYQGPILPAAPNLLPMPPKLIPNNSSIEAWGTKAIAAVKPTNPVADLSVFLGELMKDGLPSLVKSSAERWKGQALQIHKEAGSRYLDYQFGWKPLINEIRSISTAIVNADRVLRQYERDAGGVVRRRMSFPMERSYSVTQVRNNVRPYYCPSSGTHSDGTTAQGKVFRSDEETIARWFSGAFTYYLPDGYYSKGGIVDQVAQAKKLLGLTLTPSVIWNLAPWSWAVDWAFNIGDVLDNISDYVTDGLILRYGYIMEHRKVVRTYTFVGPTGYVGMAKPAPVTMVSETKVRRKASPFGFGITWDGLTATQLAIAAALGITRT